MRKIFTQSQPGNWVYNVHKESKQNPTKYKHL